MPDFFEQNTVSMDHAGFVSAVEELNSLINGKAPERALQSHIESHPYILSQQFSHCHHVFPQVQLGSQYVADFFCLDIPSSGKEWWGVELESPSKAVITKSGRKRAELEHALQQVRDWRVWVANNLSYAQHSKGKNGLGLEGIQSRFYGYVVIGQSNDYSDSFNDLRQRIYRDELIEIRSWDGVANWAMKRAKIFEGLNGADNDFRD